MFVRFIIIIIIIIITNYAGLGTPLSKLSGRKWTFHIFFVLLKISSPQWFVFQCLLWYSVFSFCLAANYFGSPQYH
jgi:hypothetical protein